jgi:hypothetical protein
MRFTVHISLLQWGSASDLGLRDSDYESAGDSVGLDGGRAECGECWAFSFHVKECK